MNGASGGRPDALEAVLDEQQDSAGTARRAARRSRTSWRGHPALREDAEAVVDLIYQEYRDPAAVGRITEPEDYLRRFPAWSDALIRQFAVDEALRSSARTVRSTRSRR